MSKWEDHDAAGWIRYFFFTGALGSLVVKALGYKPEDRGFKARWDEILNSPNPSGRTRPWGLLSL
jgi:hypothetical protein